MWYLAYRLLLWLAYPWVLVRLRLRARREPAYRERMAERFGRVPADIPRGCVWFHAVSAGETIAAAPLIAALADAHPDLPVLVTTMTPAGAAEVRRRLGGRVWHCYAPYDFTHAVRRFFAAVEPQLLILMETELWPNTIATASVRGVPVLLVNARLSARSAAGYARVAGLTRRMLADLRCIACQYPEHGARFVALGAAPDRVVAVGNVKFDLCLPQGHADRVAALRLRWGLEHSPVWIAASTHPGEEEQILAAHRLILEQLPAARLILAPRQPVRAPGILARCRLAGYAVGCHTESQSADKGAGIVLVDTMGVLLDYYGLAQVAFVGGSLAAAGGHNPIEPALCSLPVVMGPHVFNFTEVVAAFRAEGCLEIVTAPAQLAATVSGWLAAPATRARRGGDARAVVATGAGASARIRALLEAELATLRAGEDKREPLG
jgi:3-deoxy-D-manno-octulosonic-acid transferase